MSNRSPFLGYSLGSPSQGFAVCAGATLLFLLLCNNAYLVVAAQSNSAHEKGLYGLALFSLLLGLRGLCRVLRAKPWVKYFLTFLCALSLAPVLAIASFGSVIK
jgi:glucan phosphoethanolaminetransferase (alkaline phosphatase superfamily)